MAALVVVVCHALSTFPGIGSVFSNRFSGLNSLESWVVYSPLHALWNGNAAVHIFFVLSGFVLILPFTRPGTTVGWASYYAKRLLRLYLPVWGSIVLAVVLMLLIPRSSSPDQSSWANMYAVAPSAGAALKDALLLLDASGINTALWSLKWEVAFSLLLPGYVFFALRWRSLWHLKIGFAFLLTAVGAWRNLEWLSYLPIFAIGVILGAERQRIRDLTQRVRRFVWIFAAALGLLLCNAEWISPGQPTLGVRSVITAGATLIVFLFVSWTPAEALGNAALAQWLGRVSFSLYLVHLPIILGGVTLLRSASLPLAVVVSVAAALLVAELFYRYVERPAHLLSIAAGQALKSRVNRATASSGSSPEVERQTAP
jgi:peptidoglycan/LPS O-acetylase OafA/YrhL